MSRFLSIALFLALAAFVLFAAGCKKSNNEKSNNEGKIVGTWRIPGRSDSTRYLEFTADGKFYAYLMASAERTDLTWGTFSLGPGNTVALRFLNPPIDGQDRSRVTVIIENDTMTYKDEYGNSAVFTRWGKRRS